MSCWPNVWSRNGRRSPVAIREHTFMMTSPVARNAASRLFIDAEDKWAAVVRRDAAADDLFYYSVRTTGVFCRPSCASRLARRENVAFHRTCADAEKAGFRPCRRCRPNQATLAQRRAATSSKVLGMTPTDYRADRAGERIRFALGECSLGSILVAASEKGICAILLGDDPEALARDLQDRFPNAGLTGGDTTFEQWVAKVVGFVEAPRLGLDLPLDVCGTAFQQRVWQALCEIPMGSTASYAEVAESIGAPKSARAVAQACAANALAVAIPCHRVVRNNGALSGYRWGVGRKRALLDREASV